MNYFQLLKKLYDIYDSLAGRVVDHKTILRRVRGAVPFRECKIMAVRTMASATYTLEVAGLYDPVLDEEGLPPIEIEIAFPRRYENYSFTEDALSRSHWSEFCLDFANILGHEFMHLNQFRRRNFNWAKAYKSYSLVPKIRERQEYYGDPDEVDAYAFIAAAELAIDSFSPLRIKKPKLERTRMYKTYTKIFDKSDPVVLKFVKLTNRYYKKLERQYNDTTFE